MGSSNESPSLWPISNGAGRNSHAPARRVGAGDIFSGSEFYRNQNQNPITPKHVCYQPPADLYRRPSYQSVRMRTPIFNGKGKWATFIRQFEAVASGCGWSDEDRLVHLWSALSDQAADYAFDLEPEVVEHYDTLVLQLERRFRVSQTRETSQRLFYSRVLDSGENVRSYAADLKALVHKAYPQGLTNGVREDMLLKQFFDGMNDEEARYYVKYLQRPR